MNDLFIQLYILITGILLGAIFFGGLWWTVYKVAISKRPEILFFGSLLVRTSIVLAGFYLIGHSYWERFLICLLGFIMARLLVTWLTRERQGFHAS